MNLHNKSDQVRKTLREQGPVMMLEANAPAPAPLKKNKADVADVAQDHGSAIVSYVKG